MTPQNKMNYIQNKYDTKLKHSKFYEKYIYI
jgi:hypothetical protein